MYNPTPKSQMKIAIYQVIQVLKLVVENAVEHKQLSISSKN